MAGDESAWEAIVDRYQGLVWSTAVDYGLDRDDAADVFQFVWMELHQSLRRLRDPASLPKWLVVATRRQAYKVARLRRRRLGDVQVDHPALELPDPRESPEHAVLALEDQGRVREALTRMPPADARLLHLLFFDPSRPDYRQIADRMGLAVGSIGPIRGRVLRRLRQLLEEAR